MNNQDALSQLLLRARAGDPESLNRLLTQIRPLLHEYVRRARGPGPDRRGRVESSDIVQVAEIKICDKLTTLKGSSYPAFLAWAETIVRHIIDDQVRKDHADKRDLRRDVRGSKILALLIHGSTPEQRVERAEIVLHVMAALERLPEYDRVLIKWRIFDELRYSEISERTGVCESTLRVSFLRALEKLRQDESLKKLMESRL